MPISCKILFIPALPVVVGELVVGEVLLEQDGVPEGLGAVHAGERPPALEVRLEEVGGELLLRGEVLVAQRTRGTLLGEVVAADVGAEVVLHAEVRLAVLAQVEDVVAVVNVDLEW